MMVRIWAFVVLILAAGPASACELLLTSRLARVGNSNTVFTNRARAELKRLRLEEPAFREYMGANVVFAVPSGPSGFHSIVFEPNPEHADRGFVVQGEMANGRFVVHSVSRSEHFQETAYFKAVANLHSLRELTLSLPHAVLNCFSVAVKGWVQTKLWLKHRLQLSAVMKLLGSPRPMVYNSRGGRARYQLRGTAEDGRPLMVVIEEDGLCPNGLITAFEIGH